MLDTTDWGDVMLERFENATIGEIVATDVRAAAIFEDFGIDFCCGGDRLLIDACRSVSVDPAQVVRALDALPDSATPDEDVARRPLDELIDYILATHHAYVREALPRIEQRLVKLQEIHGQRHRELARILEVFGAIRAEMDQHMLKEERVLFPYIRDLVGTDQACGGRMSPFGTIENPIRMMEREHHDAAEALRVIRELTRGYVAPDDGCTTYRETMADLAQFERDLHRHVHLENNALFPQAVALEKRSWSHDRR
jgi:regulator of cell morphogenesis and NO signaling